MLWVVLSKVLRTHQVNNVNFKKTKTSTLIFTSFWQEYDKLVPYSKMPKCTRWKHRLSIDSLYAALTATYIETEEFVLQEYGLKATPLHLMSTSSSIGLKYLQQTIRHLMLLQITIEKKRNKRIIQHLILSSI